MKASTTSILEKHDVPEAKTAQEPVKTPDTEAMQKSMKTPVVEASQKSMKTPVTEASQKPVKTPVTEASQKSGKTRLSAAQKQPSRWNGWLEYMANLDQKHPRLAFFGRIAGFYILMMTLFLYFMLANLSTAPKFVYTQF